MGTNDDLIAAVIDDSRMGAPQGCGFAKAFKALDGDPLQETFVHLLGRDDATSSAICRALRAHNVNVSVSIIRRHRKGDCSCR